MAFSPSPYQQKVFDFVSSDKGSAIIQAVAGSGKTTTILQALNLIPTDKKILFLAFNKSIVEELKQKITNKSVDVQTFHGCGFSAYRKVNKCVVDADKIQKIISKIVPALDLPKIQYVIKKIVDLGKSLGISVEEENNIASWQNICNHFDIDLDEYNVDTQKILEYCVKALDTSNSTTGVIDFSDMILLPIKNQCPFNKYDWIFVDEAQDTNSMQRKMLQSLLAKNGRVIAVGDRYQAIYSFRGADFYAMDEIKKLFNCEELPLSISYRCSKEVVKEAQKWAPNVEAFDGAKTGEVKSLQQYNTSLFSKNDAILCRNNAPIISMAYNLIGKNIPISMVGRELGAGLISFIKKMKAKTVTELVKNMEDHVAYQTELLKAAGKESQASLLQDKRDCVNVFVSNLVSAKTVTELIAEIKNFFDKASAKGFITLSTCHKSKGLEWENVFILDEHLFFPRWAKKQWMIDQERNLKYVAITRAKNNLTYISAKGLK